MAGKPPFDREKFLLRAVVGVFIAQFGIFSASLLHCMQIGPRAEETSLCSKHLDNLDQTFDLALGTTLALLGGGSIAYARRVREENEAKQGGHPEPDSQGPDPLKPDRRNTSPQGSDPQGPAGP
jgi:hypothetical protein